MDGDCEREREREIEKERERRKSERKERGQREMGGADMIENENFTFEPFINNSFIVDIEHVRG